MRVYTMTRLVERGAAVDRTTQTIEVGGSARRFSTFDEAGLTFRLSFGLLEWSAVILAGAFSGRQSKQPDIRPSEVYGDGAWSA
jgi:hypothetical protein